MVILYAMPPSFGLPDASPFVMKTEVQLQMAGLPYRRQLGGRPSAPKGKLPYIDDDGTIVADSVFIRLYLEDKYKIDFDADLSEQERAAAVAVERLVEDHIYWMVVYMRWAVDANFAAGPAHFYDHLPDDVQSVTRDGMRANVLGYLETQGMGRHTVEEVGQLARRAFSALSRLLGDRPYMMGNRQCGVDASTFGQLASALTPWFESPVRDAAESHPNLVDYSQRMMALHYPDYA